MTQNEILICRDLIKLLKNARFEVDISELLKISKTLDVFAEIVDGYQEKIKAGK